jgi:hypothetical protein
MSEPLPWQLREKEWDVTERLRVSAWLGRAGVRVGVEDRVLEEQSPSLTLAEARRLRAKLEAAISWAEKVKAST